MGQGSDRRRAIEAAELGREEGAAERVGLDRLGFDRLEPAWASSLVESSPDGVVVVDRAGVMLLVNRRLEEMIGAPRDELVGQAVELLVPAAQRQVHTAHRLRYGAAPSSREMGRDLDLWARRADGAEFPVEISLSPLAGGDGLVIATIRDVSARRAAEQHMRNLTNVLAGISDAVLLTDPDTLAFTYVNRAAAALTGYPDDQLLGMTPLHVLPDLDRAGLERLLAPVRTDERAVLDVAFALRRANGANVLVEGEISLPPRLRGQAPQLVVVLRDVSDRLAREAEARAGHELAALLADRERIARDLHDTAIQDLFAAALALNAAALRADGELQRNLLGIVDRHDDVIREIRTAIFGLTSRRRGDTVSSQAAAVVDEAARVLGWRPALRLGGPLDTSTPPEVTAQVIPVLREALSNIARHAHGTRAEVDLDHHDGRLTLRVSDNGVGIGKGAEGPGRGLGNLAERAEQLGGSLTITAAEPHGATLVWSVPA
ncbi:MAG: PAS domain S-box protein [Acidimicrobiales bacterium]